MKSENKFTIIYSFKINDGKESEFLEAWSKLTKLIYKFEGSYGSRLHKAAHDLFIAYAQWPDRDTWKKSGDNLPAIALEYRKRLRESCSQINAEYELEIVEDLLQSDTYA